MTKLFLWCLKVYLGQDGQVEVYANMTIQPHSPIKRDLLLDQNGAHIYIMTKTTVSTKILGRFGGGWCHYTCRTETMCVIQQIMLRWGAFQVSWFSPSNSGRQMYKQLKPSWRARPFKPRCIHAWEWTLLVIHCQDNLLFCQEFFRPWNFNQSVLLSNIKRIKE